MNDKPMFYGASPKIFENANVLRANMTEAENILWNRLRKNQLNGYKFRRQHPIDTFIADFYCHAGQLVVEIDGKIHQDKTIKEYDEGRTYEIEHLGIKVIRFSNEEIKNNIEKVIERIKSFLNSPVHP